MGFLTQRTTRRIQQIVDISKIGVVKTLEACAFPDLEAATDEGTRLQLFVLATNDVFFEETDASLNSLRETSPKLVDNHIEAIKSTILKECSTFLSQAIKLKAFLIAENKSREQGEAYAALASKYFPSVNGVPSRSEARAIIRSCEALFKDMLKNSNANHESASQEN